jgi:hypothetical protein
VPAVTADIKFGGKLAKLRLVASGQNGQMQLALNRMLQAYSRWTVERFERMSASGGGVDPKDGQTYGKWDPLSSSTLGGLAKVRRYLLILVRTGLMREMVRNGFVNASGVTTSGYTHSISASYSPLEYEDGGVTTLDVMQFHNEGGDRLPQRKVLWKPDQATKKGLAEIGKETLLEGINE